jgi:hypothetical protein
MGRKFHAGVEKMKRAAAVFLIFGALSSPVAGEARTPYQIPQVIYIGDSGRLIVPLEGFDGVADATLPIDGLERSPALVIRGISVYRHNLIVDFQAFKTGVIALPAIAIAGKTIANLEVHVSSILANADNVNVLAPAALPLPAQGTLWMIVQAVFIALAVAAAVLLVLLRGGKLFRGVREKMRARAIVRETRRRLAKIRATMEGEAALSAASHAMRSFLERYFAVHCQAFVPREFRSVTLSRSAAGEAGGTAEKFTGAYLEQFFLKCDALRFSGKVVDAQTVGEIITEVESLVNAAAG